MPVGTTPAVCVDRLVAAMKERLTNAGLDPNNVELPEVKPNFEALGKAVFQILTTDAVVASDSMSDPAFWMWVSDVNTTLRNLASWQRAVAIAAGAWVPTTAEQGIKTALAGTAQGAPLTSPPTVARSHVR